MQSYSHLHGSWFNVCNYELEILFLRSFDKYAFKVLDDFCCYRWEKNKTCIFFASFFAFCFFALDHPLDYLTQNFWLRPGAQEVSLCVRVSVCDVCEFFTHSAVSHKSLSIQQFLISLSALSSLSAISQQSHSNPSAISQHSVSTLSAVS